MIRALAADALIGDSAPMRALRQLVETIAPTTLPVLIHGPTGAGKELVAALVHERSGRSGAFVAFNVCAIGESMFEDALFGHTKGAYTGALRESLGFLREANGGTAFFDEISGLPLPLQAKLLRAIETGTFRPIGASRDAISAFRLVAATNEDLEALVAQHRFRADLRHRLGGVVIPVPALSERIDDIPLLALDFARRARDAEISIDRDALALLQSTTWPGNVRELKHVVEVAAAFSGASIDARTVAAVLSGRTVAQVSPLPSVPHAERRALVDVLEGAGWDADAAARRLGVHRATLYRRMKRLAIVAPRATVAPSRAESHGSGATGATDTKSGML
ncbi:MAG TPA: sigma 54-interacting transcriptional regulator [Gemmatimonadaceae bacterium]|nr:sigma 54-interacting transcriptional regulator [Gemmatimonadaceae bacterium]